MLAERLRRARVEAGLTQAALARAAGVSKGYVSELEAGRKTRPAGAIVARLAQACGVTPDDLLAGAARPVAPLGFLTNQPWEQALQAFAMEDKVARRDVLMLRNVVYRTRHPETVEDWRFVFHAIKLVTTRPRFTEGR